MTTTHDSSPHNLLPPRSQLIVRSALILALPTLVTTRTMIIYRIAYNDSLVPPVPSGAIPAWVFPLLPFLVANGAALLLLRKGQTTVSALILITFWTFSMTGVIMRFGAHTFFPAMLVVPIGASSLLFARRTSFVLAIISSHAVAISAWFHMHRPGFSYQDVFTAQLITSEPRLGIGMSIAVAFWFSLFMAVALITSMLAGSLQRSLQQSAAHAAALEELSAQLEQRVADQTASLLAGEREQAMLAERTRLARDIHDTLAQGLTGIIVQIGAAQQALRAQHPDANQHIDLAARLARESLAEARRSVWNLRAEALERGDLRHALASLVARYHHSAIEASFDCTGGWNPLPIEVESALLRVAQEALANVARHAQATQVWVTLTCLPTAITLTIRDDGQGFADAISTLAATHVHFGIMGMRERISALNGTLALYDDQGAVVTATIPLKETAHAPHTYSRLGG